MTQIHGKTEAENITRNITTPARTAAGAQRGRTP